MLDSRWIYWHLKENKFYLCNFKVVILLNVLNNEFQNPNWKNSVIFRDNQHVQKKKKKKKKKLKLKPHQDFEIMRSGYVLLSF